MLPKSTCDFTTQEEVWNQIDFDIRDILNRPGHGQAIAAAIVLLKLWEESLDKERKIASALALEKMGDIALRQSEYFIAKAKKWREAHWQEVQRSLDLCVAQLRSAKPTARAVELLK